MLADGAFAVKKAFEEATEVAVLYDNTLVGVCVTRLCGERRICPRLFELWAILNSSQKTESKEARVRETIGGKRNVSRTI